MNYISILFFAILLLSVTSAGTFRGIKVFLDEIGVKSMAFKDMSALTEKVRRITFEKVKMHKKILFLNFDAIIDNIESNVSVPYPKNDGKFVEGKLTMIYESLFVFMISFTMSAKLQNTLIFNSTGKINISGKKLILTIDYTEVKPISKAEFVTEVTSAEFDSGILTSFMIDFAKKQFTSNITAKLKEIEDDYHKNDPLSALETPQISEDGSLMSSTRWHFDVEINENDLLRIVIPYLTYRDKASPAADECKTTRQSNVLSICYCPCMFLEMFTMIEAEETVNMKDWELKGKVIELYRILPNLINYYQPDADYKVIRKAHPTILRDTNPYYKLEKHYAFMIGNDTVFNMITQFNITMISGVKDKKLFVKYSKIDVLRTWASGTIYGSGWAIIRRLMQAEVNSIKDKHMFTSGIPIEAKDHMDSTDHCFDLITNP